MNLSYRIKYNTNLMALFRGGYYEHFVFSIINASNVILPYNFKKIDNQSNGECDFVCVDKNNNLIKYDAKLPFESKQIKKYLNKENELDIIAWYTQNASYEEEYKNVTDGKNIEETELYRIINKLLENNAKDENVIIFFPFPVSPKIRNSIFSDIADDYLDEIFSALIKSAKLSCRTVYLIYPSIERGLFILRDMKNKLIECIKCEELEKYMSFEIVDF